MKIGLAPCFAPSTAASASRERYPCMDKVVLMSDPRVAAVPVHECGEPLIDIRQRTRMLVDPRKQHDSSSYPYLRESVVERLCQAETSLPRGIRLLVVEGYRNPALQRRYFEDYARKLRAENPAWPEEQIRPAASRFVSPPEIAPHSAGAAVDLTLVDNHGRELNMGTAVNASPEESNGACYTDAPGLSSEAQELRAVLGAALRGVALVNYPTEWWHWSFGDRYWALATGADNACYGPASLPRT